MKRILFSIITLMMVFVPLVNAEQKAEAPTDTKYYATVTDGDVGERLGAKFECEYSPTAAASITAECSSITVQLVDKNDAGTRTPGYWYGVVLTMPEYSKSEYSGQKELGNGYIDLEKSTLKINGKDAGYVKDILDGIDSDSPRWAGIWQKVDEIKMAQKEKGEDVEPDSIVYTFTWVDGNDDNKTYTQTLTVSLDYKGTITLKQENPEAKNLHKITVEVVKGNTTSKEVLYYNSTERTNFGDLKANELAKFDTETSDYKFLRFTKPESRDEEISESEPLEGWGEDDGIEIVAIYEKKSTSSGSTSTTTPDPEPSDTEDNKPSEDKDSTPKTGNADLMGIASMMTLLSLVGIVKLKKSM